VQTKEKKAGEQLRSERKPTMKKGAGGDNKEGREKKKGL